MTWKVRYLAISDFIFGVFLSFLFNAFLLGYITIITISRFHDLFKKNRDIFIDYRP